MHLLQVTTTYYPELQFGGPPQKIHNLSCQLLQRGHTITVVTLHSQQPAVNFQSFIDGILVQYLPWIGRNNYRWPRQLELLKEAVQAADVVHGYGLYNLLTPAAARYAEELKIPFVLEPLGMYKPRVRNQYLKRMYHQFFTRPMSERASRLIATSPAEMADLAGLVEPDKLLLRRNGINVEQFTNLPDGRRLRTAFHIPQDAHIILYLGRISPIKNLETLIDAYQQAQLPNTWLLLVGPTLEQHYADELRLKIKKFNLEEQVLLTGALYGEEKLAAFAAADLFVLPSHFESFGNAAAEAVVAGLPVLITDGCGIAPQIHQRAGLSVQPTVEALAAGLHCLLLDEQAKTALTRGRTELIQQLSWERPIDETEILYRSLVN